MFVSHYHWLKIPVDAKRATAEHVAYFFTIC